jgi:hypothetical protein
MLTNDIELNGVSFNVVPGTYKKGLRKRQAVSKPAARKIMRTTFGPFTDGFGQALAAASANTGGWSGVTVGPAFDGLGVEPFPNSASFADPMAAVPSATTRAYGLIAGDAAYVGIGTRLYKSVLLSSGAWSAWTLQTTYSQPITGMTYFLDDVMLFFGTAQDIRRFNTAGGATTVWRTGEKARYGVAYAGQKR